MYALDLVVEHVLRDLSNSKPSRHKTFDECIVEGEPLLIYTQP